MWWKLCWTQLCLLSKPESFSLPELQQRDPSRTSQMHLSLTNTVKNMVRYQCQDGYLFSDHILGGPWSIWGHLIWYPRVQVVKWWDSWQNNELVLCTHQMNEGTVARLGCLYLPESPYCRSFAITLSMGLCACAFPHSATAKALDGGLLAILWSPATCCVLASAGFWTRAQSFDLGLVCLHQLRSEGSEATMVCHENLQLGSWIDNGSWQQWYRSFALAV